MVGSDERAHAHTARAHGPRPQPRTTRPSHLSAQYSLISGFVKMCFQKKRNNVIILGLDRAGKTTFLEQLKGIFGGLDPLPASKIPPTVGLNIGRLQISQQSLVLWDLGGAPNLRSLWDKYTPEAHGLVYVVDAAAGARLEEARQVLCDLLSSAELQGIPLLVLANKQDADGALTPHEVEESLELQQVLEPGQARCVIGCTTVNGEGVSEGAIWMADVLRDSTRVPVGGSGGERW